jgi:hypothetical protein
MLCFDPKLLFFSCFNFLNVEGGERKLLKNISERESAWITIFRSLKKTDFDVNEFILLKEFNECDVNF